MGLNDIEDVLTTEQSKQLFHPKAQFCAERIEHCKLIDEYLELPFKAHYLPVNPTHLSELFHWQTLTLLLDYCDTHCGILTGSMDYHVPVNYIDSHCHVDRLSKLGVNGNQDAIPARYAEVKDTIYEGCISNLVDPWLWDGPLHSSIIDDPKVHITVGLHPKHYNKMGKKTLR